MEIIMKKLKLTQIIFLNLLLLSIVFSQDINFSGFGNTGWRLYDRNINEGYSQETYYGGKFQANIEFNKNIESQLDFRGNSIDNSVELREFSIKFKYSDKLRWKVGNIKKPFGYEISVNRDRLISVERSNVYNSIAKLGYGGRTVSVMAYRKYSKKQPDFPFSYYLSLSKDNSFTTNVTGRGIYHSGDYSYGLSYMFQNRGGRMLVQAHGFAADFLIDKKNYSNSIELFFVKDPLQSKINEEMNTTGSQDKNENVYTGGAKILTSISFKTDAEVITKIEPLVMFSCFVPDVDVTDTHVIQFLIGSNFYFTKKIRLRFNGDVRLTKNENSDKYATNQSGAILELMVRF